MRKQKIGEIVLKSKPTANVQYFNSDSIPHYYFRVLWKIVVAGVKSVRQTFRFFLGKRKKTFYPLIKKDNKPFVCNMK